MLKACKGTAFRDYRDTAVIRFMVETGSRAGETAAMDLPDMHWQDGYAIVRRGKGGKGRTVPFGPFTTEAISTYLRKARTGHRLAGTPALWLGERGKAFGYDGLYFRAGVPRRRRWHPRLPPPPTKAHRRPPLAGRWRLRRRPDGSRWLDPAGHAPSLHQGPSRSARRRRSPPTQPGGLVTGEPYKRLKLYCAACLATGTKVLLDIQDQPADGAPLVAGQRRTRLREPGKGFDSWTYMCSRCNKPKEIRQKRISDTIADMPPHSGRSIAI